MRDIHSEVIEFKSYSSFLAFGDELWSGAKEKWDEADLETREMVWDRVKEWADAVSCDGELPDLTQINDMIWFDCDDIFYPPKFKVRVARPRLSEEPIFEETFEGIDAENEAREWWENKKSEDDDALADDEEIVAHLINMDTGEWELI